METRYVVTYIDRNNGDLEAYHAAIPAGSPEGAAELLLASRSWAQVVDVSDIQELRGVIDILEAQSPEEMSEHVLGALLQEDARDRDLRDLLQVAEDANSPTLCHAIHAALDRLTAGSDRLREETV